jgi:hypothetical protein
MNCNGELRLYAIPLRNSGNIVICLRLNISIEWPQIAAMLPSARQTAIRFKENLNGLCHPNLYCLCICPNWTWAENRV